LSNLCNFSVHQRIAFGFQADNKTSVKDVYNSGMIAGHTNTLRRALVHQEHLAEAAAAAGVKVLLLLLGPNNQLMLVLR
jgi:hypothetical protein